MDHVPAGQAVGSGDPGLAGGAAAEPPALGQQFQTRRPVDAAVHPAAAQQGRLGGVDDGVHGHFCDIVANDDKGHGLTTHS